MINAEQVTAAFRQCLYPEIEEVDGKQQIPEDAIIVDGVVMKVAFIPEGLEIIKELVRLWLEELPHQFRDDSGGGWSFLNACNLETGEQWTGLHQVMDQLFCLAVALDLASCQLPREMWDALPGGMPYYVLHLNKEAAPSPHGG
jgi:hypothetical protein